MGTKKLTNGFYWVKRFGEHIIAQYYNGDFLIPGNEYPQDLSVFEEINERVEREKMNWTKKQIQWYGAFMALLGLLLGISLSL